MLPFSTTSSCWIDSVGAVRDDTSGRDPHRLAGRERPRRGHPGGDPEDDRQRSRRVRRADGVAVHRRARERRQVDHRGRRRSEHAARPPPRSAPTRQPAAATRSSTSAWASSSVRSSSTTAHTLPPWQIAGHRRPLPPRTAPRHGRHVRGLGGRGSRARAHRRRQAARSRRGRRALRARGSGGGRARRTRTSARSTTTAKTTAGGSWCSSTCRAARSRSGSSPEGRSPTATRARIAAEIAAGLAHAHLRGVVHRDLKPANILFDAAGPREDRRLRHRPGRRGRRG